MVFDIFEVKRDGEKVRKGKLRLRDVQSQQSFATILAAHDVPKFCPKCGWTTNDITHIFCTYCLGGEDEKEREAQRLTEGSTKDRVTAPEFLNPVKAGDFVSSPFYLGRLKQKAFSFAIIGQAADRSSQEIGMFLKENGCTLTTNITLETDFAIVGLGPNVWQEVERARKMGVSVIRESELFDFFGQTGTSPDAPPRVDGTR
jgi:NAD-dependent DNA ligase